MKPPAVLMCFLMEPFLVPLTMRLLRPLADAGIHSEVPFVEDNPLPRTANSDAAPAVLMSPAVLMLNAVRVCFFK